MSDTSYKTHPSWGMATLSRMISRKANHMFGVNSPTSVAMVLRIHQAKVESDAIFAHNLKGHSILPMHGKEHQICTVEFSPTQWGQLLCSAGLGEGTPCTITRVNGELREYEPYIIDSVSQAARHMKKTIDKLSGEVAGPMDNLKSRIEELPVSQKKKDELLKDLSILASHLKANTSFVVEEFTEHAEQVASELTNNVMASGTTALLGAGVEVMRDRLAEGGTKTLSLEE